MPADPRLALTKDFREFAHGQLGRLEQVEDAQPRLLAGRFETREQSAEGERRRSFIRHKHIFISIFCLVKSNGDNLGGLRALPVERLGFLGSLRFGCQNPSL